MDLLLKLQGLFGLFVFMALAWALSDKRKNFPLRLVIISLTAQFILALVLLKVPPIRMAFEWLNQGVLAIEAATAEGSRFIFGYLAGGPTPFEITAPQNSYIIAFQTLPFILVVGALVSLFTYFKIIPTIVRGISFALERSLKIGGAVGLAAGANIFVGPVESPLFIKDYMSRISRSELFMVMTLGMATIAGTVMFLYVSVLQGTIPEPLTHLLIASIISLPAAIAIAAIMVPPNLAPTPAEIETPIPLEGPIDAIVTGTLSAGKLLMNVVAMLLVFVALVALFNAMLGAFPDISGEPLTLQRIFGWVFAPICWCLGLPWEDAVLAGQMMGVKTVLNELFAFFMLAGEEGAAMSERSRLIMSYALCGFANFASLGILVGGLQSLAPERRAEISALSLRALVAGTLATCSTAAVVGIII